jgi:hypothetical protein
MSERPYSDQSGSQLYVGEEFLPPPWERRGLPAVSSNSRAPECRLLSLSPRTGIEVAASPLR